MWRMEQVCVYPAAFPSQAEYICPFIQLSLCVCVIPHQRALISYATSMLFIYYHRKLNLCLFFFFKCTSVSLWFSFYSWVLEASFFSSFFFFSSLWLDMNQALVDSLGGVSYFHLVSNRMELANLMYHLLMSAFSNSLRC